MESVDFLPYWIVCPTKHHILVLNEQEKKATCKTACDARGQNRRLTLKQCSKMVSMQKKIEACVLKKINTINHFFIRIFSGPSQLS